MAFLCAVRGDLGCSARAFAFPTEAPEGSRRGALHRPDRTTHDISDLRFAQVVEVSQYEGGALPRWQLSKHSQQVGTRLDASKVAYSGIVVVRFEGPGRFRSEL